MKNFKILLAVLTAVSLTLSGCGKKAPEETGNEKTASEILNESMTAAAVSELDTLSQQLKPLMETALKNGAIDQTRYDEFAHYIKRINDIKLSGGNSDQVKKELQKIKENMAAMASQVSASNELIDQLVKPETAFKTEETEAQENNSQENGSQENSGKETLSLAERVNKSSSSYILFQNECSRRVDLGEIAQDDYMDIVSYGIKLAELKEKTDAGQVNDELENELKSLKTDIHTAAVNVNSALASEFE